MITVQRRLLNYAKQTNRATFTPAQIRRTIKKARTQAALLALTGKLDENNQDHLDTITMVVAGRDQTVISRILVREPS
jgi:hypothetical protein